MSFLRKNTNRILAPAVNPVKGSLFATVLVMTMLIIMVFPFYVEASTKTLRGEIDFEHVYETNPDRISEDEDYDSRSIITPRMIFTRTAQKSSLSLTYAPSLVYSYQREEERVDHWGAGQFEVYLADRLRWELENTYVQSDDPYRYTEFRETADGEFELADRRGRRKYWTNRFTTSMNLNYARESDLTVGYTYHVLRDNYNDFDNFTRHSPFSSLSHQFNRYWSTALSYMYTFGEQDDDDDIIMHGGNAAVYYHSSPFTRIFTRGAYMQTEFENGPGDDDYSVYSATLGIDREFSPIRSMAIETGVSIIDRNEGDNTEAFFLRTSFNTLTERGSWRLYAESGTDERYFRGTRRFDDDGLSRYWLVGAAVSHALTSNLTGNAGLSYREDRYIERTDSDQEIRYSGSVGLSYSFARYYLITTGYSYIELDADREFDSYDNHRVFIRLTAGQDFFRW